MDSVEIVDAADSLERGKVADEDDAVNAGVEPEVCEGVPEAKDEIVGDATEDGEDGVAEREEGGAVEEDEVDAGDEVLCGLRMEESGLFTILN